MDRNTILGIVLIAIILIFFSIINKPSQEEIEATRQKQDSIRALQQEMDELARQRQEAITDTAFPVTEEIVEETIDIVTLQNQYGAFANALRGTEQFVTIENDLLKLKLFNKGGRPYSVELKGYETHDGQSLILFDGDSTIFNLEFFAQNRNINTQNMYFEVISDSENVIVTDNPETIIMRLRAGENRYMDFEYTLSPDEFMVDFNIRLVELDQLIASNINYLNLNWEIYAKGQEKGRQNELNYTSLYYKYFQGEVDNFKPGSSKKEEIENIPNRLKWVAYKQQFFSSVIISNDNFVNALLKTENFDEEDHYLKKFTSELGVPYDPKPDNNIELAFYFGPNHYNTLRNYDMELEELVSVGRWIIKWINRFIIIPIFNWLNNFIGSYGIIILLLTIIIKLGLLPLTYKSYMSMAKMRVLKPQIDELTAKFPKKEDAMQKQQATMALYKKAGVNPMGGCLPLLLQMPILFAMFRFFPTSIELRQESFLWATDLSTYDSILEWDTYIPLISNFYGNHVSLFTILMTISTILTIKLSNQAAMSGTQMPGMKTMMYIMPVMFMFILNNFSAALTYYYFLANMITFGQNALFKRLVDDEAILKKIQLQKKKPVKKSKFMERLEQAQKQRTYKGKRK